MSNAPEGLHGGDTSSNYTQPAAAVEFYANRHIPNFLALCSRGNVDEGAIQVLDDGRDLTATSLLEGTLDISRPILVQDTPESIGMTVFRPHAAVDDNNNTVTVRHVADVIGHLYPVRVMDVEHQEELQGWTMGDLVDYFEDEDRLQRVVAGKRARQQQQQQQSFDYDHRHNYHEEEHKDDSYTMRKFASYCGTSIRSQRKAAQKAENLLLSDQNRPRILNQISLEFSDTPLGKQVVSPQFVRDLDWIDHCWPSELRKNKQSWPSVQYYCLTSTAGCYTDFHVDFGGTAVWYHVLSGSKQFCLIAPTKQNLTIYEQWLGHHDQESIFLPDMIPNQTEVLTVSLQASQTLFIPTGWIHAVYTPDDSVVLGGNFLHGLDLSLQLEVDAIESRTRVPDKFRFPFFREIHFFAAGQYLQKLHNNDTLSARELKNIPALLNALETWIEEAHSTSAATPTNKSPDFWDAAVSVAVNNACATVCAFLQTLRNEYQRATNKNGIHVTQRLTTKPNDLQLNPFGRQGLIIIPPDGPPNVTRHGNCLGSPKSPKIRLKLSASSKKRTQEIPESAKPKNSNKSDDGGFRITISSVAKELHKPLPRTATTSRKGKFREDIEYVDLAHDDDDWVPSSSVQSEHDDRIGKKTKAAGAKAPSAANKRRGPGQTHVRPPAAKKTKTTSRQRLLKKFR